MNDLNPDEKGKSCCAVENAASSCCQPTAGNVSSCCSPRDGSWSKGKVIISVIIIVAAIGVGANSFVRGTSTQADKTGPTESFFVGLTGRPAAESEKGDKADQVPKRDQVSVLGVLEIGRAHV